MRIGLLGGSFDPVHKGHIAIAKEAIKDLHLDAFHFIPTKNNPWKDTCVASAKDRMAMLQIAIDDARMSVDPIECDSRNNEKNYTIHTLEALCSAHPDDEFYFLMGMDQACAFEKWVEAKKISEMVQLVAFNRSGYSEDHQNLETYHFIKLDNQPMHASSTEIKAGDLSMIAPPVLHYASMHGLYIDTMIRPRLSEKRYQHSLSVAKLTAEFAQSNGADPLKGYIAGVMHDVAKELDHDLAKKMMKAYYPDHLDSSRPIWHQWLSSYVARHEFYIDDEEILKAIEDHTTASTSMTTLGKCLYCADKLDPLRGYDSSAGIALCNKDIDAGFASQLIQFYEFSKKKNRPIDEIFFTIYKKYVKE